MANSFFRSSTGDTTPPEVTTEPNLRAKRMRTSLTGAGEDASRLSLSQPGALLRQAYAADTKSLTVVPIYAATDDASKPQKLATIEELYTQIVKDLTEGIAAMDVSGMKRADRQYIDQTVAKGALARAYMDMGKWSEA